MRKKHIKELINNEFNKITPNNYGKIKKVVEGFNYINSDITIHEDKVAFRKNNKHFIIAMLCSFVLFFTICIPISLNSNLNAYSYSILDINPNVAIVSDNQGNVVNVVPKNADGAVLVKYVVKDETKIKDYKLDEFAALLIKSAYELNYIKNNDVKFNFYSNNSIKNKKLHESVKVKLNNVLDSIHRLDSSVTSKLMMNKNDISTINYEKAINNKKSLQNLNLYTNEQSYQNVYSSNDAAIRKDVINILKTDSAIDEDLPEYNEMDKLMKVVYSSQTYLQVYLEYRNVKNDLFKDMVEEVIQNFDVDVNNDENMDLLRVVIEDEIDKIANDTNIVELNKEDLLNKLLEEKSLNYIRNIKEKDAGHIGYIHSFTDLAKYVMSKINEFLENISDKTNVNIDLDDTITNIVVVAKNNKYNLALSWLINDDQNAQLSYDDYIELKLESKLQNRK